MIDTFTAFGGATTIAMPPKPKYKLKIADGTYIVTPTMPSAWVRFWQRVLLGWTWWELKD